METTLSSLYMWVKTAVSQAKSWTIFISQSTSCMLHQHKWHVVDSVLSPPHHLLAHPCCIARKRLLDSHFMKLNHAWASFVSHTSWSTSSQSTLKNSTISPTSFSLVISRHCLTDEPRWEDRSKKSRSHCHCHFSNWEMKVKCLHCATSQKLWTIGRGRSANCPF